MGVTMVMEVICRVICKVTTGKVICKGTTGKVVIIGKVVICNNKGCREECKVVDMVIDKVIIHRGILNLLVKFQGKSCDVMCQTFISTGQSVLILSQLYYTWKHKLMLTWSSKICVHGKCSLHNRAILIQRESK